MKSGSRFVRRDADSHVVQLELDRCVSLAKLLYPAELGPRRVQCRPDNHECNVGTLDLNFLTERRTALQLNILTPSGFAFQAPVFNAPSAQKNGSKASPRKWLGRDAGRIKRKAAGIISQFLT